MVRNTIENDVYVEVFRRTHQSNYSVSVEWHSSDNEKYIVYEMPTALQDLIFSLLEFYLISSDGGVGNATIAYATTKNIKIFYLVKGLSLIQDKDLVINDDGESVSFSESSQEFNCDGWVKDGNEWGFYYV